MWKWWWTMGFWGGAPSFRRIQLHLWWRKWGPSVGCKGGSLALDTLGLRPPPNQWHRRAQQAVWNHRCPPASEQPGSPMAPQAKLQVTWRNGGKKGSLTLTCGWCSSPRACGLKGTRAWTYPHLALLTHVHQSAHVKNGQTQPHTPQRCESLVSASMSRLHKACATQWHPSHSLGWMKDGERSHKTMVFHVFHKISHWNH